MTMKLLVLSDLHLDFVGFSATQAGKRIDEQADAVVLAGDICEGSNGLRWARQAFGSKPIIYVAGNHEFYRHSIDELLIDLRDDAARLGIHFLERDSVRLKDVNDGGEVLILGTTLWTDFEYFGPSTRDAAMDAADRGLNDFHLIRRTDESGEGGLSGLSGQSVESLPFTPHDALALHMQSRDWLKEQLDLVALTGDPARTVVVTHHAPSDGSVEPHYRDSKLTACFASNLEHLMGRSRYWIHGHMHSSHRYTVSAPAGVPGGIGTEVVCNPRGYAHRYQSGQENAMFEPALLIEV